MTISVHRALAAPLLAALALAALPAAGRPAHRPSHRVDGSAITPRPDAPARDAVPGPYGGVGDPDLLRPGARDVPAPGTPEACRARREALAAELGDGVFLASAGEEGDARFQADEDFHWLTGLHRPDARLVLVARGGELVEDTLYLPVQTETQRTWEGPKLSPADLGPDGGPFSAVRPAEELDLAALAEAAGPRGVHAVDDGAIAALVEAGVEVRRGRTALNRLQVIKTPAELAALEAAIDITQAALADAMVIAVPGAFEFQAEAAVESGFRRRGAEFLAFPSICGSGVNSCYLHYRSNQRRLEDGDLLLLDVGASYEGYCADVTRTIPVNGRFTERQREVYELVWEAQQLAEARLRPGVTMRELHEAVVAFFDERGVRRHFKHGLGHQLGIRVHDVPGFRGELEPGMVVTIEPGLYLVEEALGVRIEDDFVVTEDGCRRLSDSIPSAPDALEAYLARLRAR